MLRVGLTGGLGSGKTTVASMFASMGAHVLAADEIARALMQPGQAVFTAIVNKFGAGVLRADGMLDRPMLAQIAFGEGRVEELNAIVHPATIARQDEMATEIERDDAQAVVMVESALIFETKYNRAEAMHNAGWRSRFDRMILVRASEEQKVARFVARSGGGDAAQLEGEARRRLATMIPDEGKAAMCDFVIVNDGTLDRLREQAEQVWAKLRRESQASLRLV